MNVTYGEKFFFLAQSRIAEVVFDGHSFVADKTQPT
jgi:hypothetical protein